MFTRHSEYLTDVREAWGPYWPAGSVEAVWMALGSSKRVGRIDKTTGELVVSEELEGICYAISEVRNAWLYGVAGKRLYQFDPTTLAVQNSFELYKEERGDGWVDQRGDVLVVPTMDGIAVHNAETLALLYEQQVHFHVGKIDYDEPNTRWILYSRVGSEAAYYTLPSTATAWPTDECYWLFSITYNYTTEAWNTPVFEDYGCAETLLEDWYEDALWPEAALLIQVATGVACSDLGWCPDDPGLVVPDDPSLVTWADWIEANRPAPEEACGGTQPNATVLVSGESDLDLAFAFFNPDAMTGALWVWSSGANACNVAKDADLWRVVANAYGSDYILEDISLIDGPQCVGGVLEWTGIIPLAGGGGAEEITVILGGP